MRGSGHAENATRRSRDRLAAAVAVVAALVLLLVGPLVGPRLTGRTVLLVSGFHGSPAGFDVMRTRLADLGIPSIEVHLPGEDNVANAAVIRDIVDGLTLEGGPDTTVDIVAHSMGGLSSRWYARFLGGSPDGAPARIAHYVSLGTPQQGLPGTCTLPMADGGQMCPAGPFLAQLNAGDPTPGGAAWTAIRSTDDGLVPPAAAVLDGACLVTESGVGHFALRTNPHVFADIVRALRGECPGQPGGS